AVVVKFRRSGGDERQQMKWLTYSSFLSGAIFVLVLASIFLNLNIDFYVSTLLFDLLLVPIPVSIGIAILKYRLYDIDFIINRTLVYVPLTGVLAGLYSATVALTQKLFVALTGEKSDAAIVITTLVLASLFTPIKNALQSLVDRRFKEAPDNTKKLKAFGKEMETTVYDINPQRAASRLLSEAMTAFHAKSGAVYLGQDGNLQLIRTEGSSPGGAELRIPLQINGNPLGMLELGPRHNGVTYNQQERDVLQQVADQAADAIDSSLDVKQERRSSRGEWNIERAEPDS
ncbi:MAG: GAF domain-containing protein, partial [Chloroflexota bacterium]|nr:GAF domain-containing protein [Chloroflexota bacterium]